MDFLIKIKSFYLMRDVRPGINMKNVLLGTFEDNGFYGWFIEGKNKDLLSDLLWEAKEGLGGRPVFPYIPLARKKIPLDILDYEVWFPILKKAGRNRPDRYLGWSRTDDLSLFLSEEELQEIKIDPFTVFTVLCYTAEDDSQKWKRARKFKPKEKQNA